MELTNERAARQSRRTQSWAFWSLAALLFAAVMLGGGGSRYAINEMLIQLAALPAFAVGLGGNAHFGNWRAVRIPVILLFLGVFLAFLQVLPLPPQIWQSLPGREEITQAALLTGRAQEWRSWSINPELTVQTSLSLIIPLAVIMSAGLLDARLRRTLLYFLVILVLVNLLLGFSQSVSGGQSFYLYNSSHNGLPIGLFANRNHSAQLLLLGMFLFAGLMMTADDKRWRGGGRLMIIVSVLFVLTFSIIATNSRTVSMLLLPAFLFLAWQFTPSAMKRRGAAITAFGSLLVGLGLAALASSGKFSVVNRLFDRFAASDDHRFEFWPDAVQAMWVYFPFGSGLGSFDMVFRAHEPLASVGQQYVNNAHNDYLELAIETGVLGPLLIIVFLLWFLIRMLSSRKIKGMPLYAAAAIIGVLAHSLVDYPLRSYAILAFASMMLTVFALPDSSDENQGRR